MEQNNQPQAKRDVAVKVKIKHILEGVYVKEEGWKPNYVRTIYGENIFRVNIMGVVVSDPSVEERNQSIVIDDGSDRIVLRSFEDGLSLSGFVLGDVVNVIGKPREYMGSKYIIPEIVRKIVNNKWLELRKNELESVEKKHGSSVLSVKKQDNFSFSVEEDVVEDVSDVDAVLNLIRSLDKGDGVLIDEIISSLKKEGIEKMINSLLEQGDIFEIQPGKVKILE